MKDDSNEKTIKGLEIALCLYQLEKLKVKFDDDSHRVTRDLVMEIK